MVLIRANRVKVAITYRRVNNGHRMYGVVDAIHTYYEHILDIPKLMLELEGHLERKRAVEIFI